MEQLYPRFYIVSKWDVEDGRLWGIKDSWTQLGPRYWNIGSCASIRTRTQREAFIMERRQHRAHAPHDCFANKTETHVMGCCLIDCSVCGISLEISCEKYDHSKDVTTPDMYVD